MDSFRPGKLHLDLMAELLSAAVRPDPSVIVGPGIGEDAAVIDFGPRYLVAKTDPITFATDRIGWYAVTVNANDIATRGARPRWFLATVLLPETGTDQALTASIFAQMRAACDGIGVTLVGGHTEVTIGLDRPIVVGTMLGEVERDRLISTSGLSVGDRILLTKGVPIEGAAILAVEAGERLMSMGVAAAELDAARSLLDDPGISVSREAAIAAATGWVTSMHDPTEGGVATALLEMARAARVGLRVRRDRIPVLPVAERLCAALGLDPLGVIASGALLIGVRTEGAEAVIEALRSEGIPVAEIGEAVPEEEGATFVRVEHCDPIPYFEKDEIARIL